jgi:hypothetical protein
MKPLLCLVPALWCLAACQSTPTTPAAPTVAVPAPTKTSVAPVNSAPVAPEFIEWGTLTVNDKPHEELTTKLLVSQLGRPDSIAKGAVECGSELENLNKLDAAAGDFWYYGKTAYEVSGNQAILASFDVTAGNFQGKLGQLPLNQHTTLEDVRRFFPVSAKEADVPATGRPGEVMSLPFYHKGVQEEASLNLIFKKGRLQEVEFFFPC